MQNKVHNPSRTKQVLGVGMILFAWVVIAVYSVFQIVYVNDMYTNIFDGGVLRTVVSYQAESDTRALGQVFAASVIHAHNPDETERQIALNALMVEAQQIRTSLFIALDEYDLSVVIDPMQTQAWVHARLEITHSLRQHFELISNHFLQEMFHYARIGDYNRTRSVFSESAAPFFSLTDEVNHLIEISEISMQNAFFHTQDTINATVMTITAIGVMAIIGSIIVAFALVLPKRNY